MAKFSRFDARNKKNARHKKQSLDRDIRIRRVDEDEDKYARQALRKIKFQEFYDEEDVD